MSGLIGFLNFAPDTTRQHVRAAKQRLCRFQWNTWDQWMSSDGTLALGRVDIGTFNPQPQPVTSPDGQVVVLLSGELYRTESLRRELEAQGHEFRRQDDPELVLYAYLAYGPDFVSRLEGMFHLAILDQGKQELLIANDLYLEEILVDRGQGAGDPVGCGAAEGGRQKQRCRADAKSCQGP